MSRIGRFLTGGSEPVKPPAAPRKEPKIAAGDARIAPVGSGDLNGIGHAPASRARQAAFVEARVYLHRYLMDKINLSLLEQLERDELVERIRPLVREYVREAAFAVNAKELDQLVKDTTDEMLGLGPIEPLLKDETVSDILINTHESVYVERFGLLEDTPIRFKDEDHLMRIVNKIVSAVGRRIDESSPLVDARLLDGSRVNVAVKPVAVDGPLVSIRKFSRRPYTMESLVQNGSMASVMRELLTIAVKGRVSLIISGGTGSGKTTLLNALSSRISPKERLITIEDAAELQLQQPHVGRMETRPPNIEGKGEIRQRELVKNALRMRPDRIIDGEVRGEEAFDMLQAMNTGHEGSMTTIHANSPRDALGRLEQMVGMAGMPMSQMSVRGQIASAIALIVQAQRLSDGTRRVTSISEITGMEGEVIQMQEIFRYRVNGIADDHKIIGDFVATGVRPRFLKALESLKLKMPDGIFEPGKVVQ